mgnify:CR=1 FL=1
MNANPWLVDSIKAFSFLNCPECAFRTKGENLFAYHAAKNHPLSSAFYDQQIELENSSIGLKTVEYSSDFNSKLEAIKSKNTDESNDPLACKEQLKLVQHCEKEFANHDESFENDFENINSGADDAYEEFADESLADESPADENLADESFENDFEI